jgi:peptidoglycan/LPS O-acetylase OafA/YrhL
MRYENLQCLRAAAAAAVVLAHAPVYGRDRLGTPAELTAVEGWFTSGLAVVTFFALSGFVLAHALRSGSLRAFLGFRLLRLLPAYWVAFGLVLAVHLSLGTLLPFGWKGLPYALRFPEFWSAVFLVPAGPGGAMYVLGVEWTLVYELCLSFAVGVLAVAGRRWGLGIGAAVWLALCLWKQAVAPVGYNAPQLPRPAEWPLSAANVPFLLGVLAYLTHHRWAAFRQWVPVAAALALASAGVVPAAHGGWATILQGAAAALTIGYLASGRQAAADHPAVVAGDWSYGVYLLHVPVLCVFFSLSARHGWFPPTAAAVVFGGVLAFSIGAAYGAAESAAYRRIRAALSRRAARATAARLAEQPAVRRAA